MEIKATIFEDAEAWLVENLKDLHTDGVAAVYPTSSFDADWGRNYYDEEEDKTVYFRFINHVEALEQLVNLVNDKKLFVGGIKSAVDLTDAGNWDAEVVDVYYQLLYHGKVIYG